jgi:hypothetical protein
MKLPDVDTFLTLWLLLHIYKFPSLSNATPKGEYSCDEVASILSPLYPATPVPVNVVITPN